MKRRHMVADSGLLRMNEHCSRIDEPSRRTTIAQQRPPVTSPEKQMMAALVDASSRACARDVADAQAAGQLARAYRNGPAHVIAQLVDAGETSWAGAFFQLFVDSLHTAEQLVGLESIRSETALVAISEHVVEQTADVEAWQGVLYSLEAEDFPGWPDTYAC
ncbi:hypothetical protein [Arthrobacter sp. M4]|uniref:hypothetical protein n=1 Tax=Arthrobacter sp. M4 TaxID=218160 RepID=UPI001CDCFCC8|nr:hypothetical protein [Arthrobacter sp. M4]MCA4134849.1 hypothetical protein [Arthrobacter sp. M4]